VVDTEPIRDFVRREFLYDKTATLADDDTLFPDLVDSLGMMEVLDFVEDTYGIEIAEDELEADRFRTLRAIGEFIATKQR
jgi:acyl carrier protein